MPELQLNVKTLVANEIRSQSIKRSNNENNKIYVAGENPKTVRVYKRRFLYLMLFSVSSLISDITYSQYSIASDFLSGYYRVSVIAVQWTSLVYALGLVVPVYPTLILVENKGIKFTFVMGLFTVAAGMWLQGIGTNIHCFWLILLGQCVISTAQCCFCSLTPQFVSYWFPVHQVSTACAVGIFFNIAGMALSCIFTPIILDVPDSSTIGLNLSILNYTLAAITTALSFVILFFFKEKPPLPPSEAQAQLWDKPPNTKSASSQLGVEMKELMKNWNFVLHLFSSGMFVSVIIFAVIILNQLLSVKYPGQTNDIGAIGLIMYFMGIPGALVMGAIIDKTHKYKETVFICDVCIFLSLCFFVGAIYINITAVYVATVIFGFFAVGYLNIGMEMASEITYPISEVTSSTMILLVGSVLGILMTYLTNWLLRDYNIIVSLVVLIIYCLLPAIAAGFVKSDLRRLTAEAKQQQMTRSC